MMAADNALDRGQPQATAGELRREKRFKHPALRFGIHAATGVDDIKEHVAFRG